MNEPLDHIALSDEEKKLLDKVPDADHETRLVELQVQLDQLNSNEQQDPGAHHRLPRALLSIKIAGILLDLDRKSEAWDFARPSVDVLIEEQRFEDAALACQFVYLADQFDAIPAIGQAAWLAVTYPVDPHLTANILNHIIDETPDESDGAAVAAAAAHFVADLRCTDQNRDELRLFTGANLARVARRHSNITTQQDFDQWVDRMELDQPDKFLVRLRNVIDVMVQFDWWFDREHLVSELPN